MIPEGVRARISSSVSQPSGVTAAKPSVVTESITKTTFTETTVKRVTNTAVTEQVAMRRSGGPLGLSIIGGSDHSCVPFGTGEQGIYVSKIIPGGSAAATGKLRMGDRILAVNTTDIRNVTHQEAVMALLQHCQVMKLTVQHDPLPPGFKEIAVVKQPGEKLGMIIKGGLRGQPGNPLDPADEGVFCVKVDPGSRASIESGIEVGQRIIEVNGQSLLGATHQEAVAILRNAGDEIKLLVCDGFNPASVPSTGSESQDTSQLDLHPLVPPVLANHTTNGDPQVRLAEPPSPELPEDLDKSNTSSSSADEEPANQTVIITSSLPEQDELAATPSSQVSSQSPQPAFVEHLDRPKTPQERVFEAVRAAEE